MKQPSASLLEIQRAVCADLTRTGVQTATHGVLDDGLSANDRLAIYRHTMHSTLITALQLAYPAVRRIVGDAFFEGAAWQYIHQHPARDALLDRYGGHFAAFLRHFEPAASLPYLEGVASLEWAVNRALHAPDIEPLNLERFAARGMREPATARLAPHPALGLLRSDWPVDVIWQAVLDGDDAALRSVDPQGGPVWLLVERSADTVLVSRLSESEWQLTQALCAGTPLQTCLDQTRLSHPHELLAAHLAAGRFTDILEETP